MSAKQVGAVFALLVFSLPLFALEQSMIDVKGTKADVSVDGVQWYTFEIDGKKMRSEVVHFGPTGGVFYTENTERTAKHRQVYLDLSSGQFYVSSDKKEDVHWILDSEDEKVLAREKLALKDIGRLFFERLQNDSAAKKALKRYFGFGEEIPAEPIIEIPAEKSLSVGALNLKSMGPSQDEELRSYFSSPSAWGPVEGGACTTVGCWYQFNANPSRRVFVPLKFKGLVEIETGIVQLPHGIEELVGSKDVQKFFDKARRRGSRYVVLSFGNLDTCTYCRKLHTCLDNVVTKRKRKASVAFLHINNNLEVAKSYGYQEGGSIPFSVTFDLQDGGKPEPFTGYLAEDVMAAKLPD